MLHHNFSLINLAGSHSGVKQLSFENDFAIFPTFLIFLRVFVIQNEVHQHPPPPGVLPAATFTARPIPALFICSNEACSPRCMHSITRPVCLLAYRANDVCQLGFAITATECKNFRTEFLKPGHIYINCCRFPLLGENLGLFPKCVHILCFSNSGR